MTDRRETNLMGKIIGTHSAWDQLDNWALVFYDFSPNDLGKRFVPDFSGPRDLAVNFENGEASVHDENGNETLLRSDWSMFNRTVEAPGWQSATND